MADKKVSVSFGNPIVWVVILAILGAGVFIAFSWFSSQSGKPPQTAAPTTSPLTSQTTAPPVSPAVEIPEQPTKGVADAPVTIVEFAEFYCPYCARHVRETIPKIEEEYIQKGLVKYVFHNLVVHGEVAELAAQAGECAHAQGHFWEYHDRLFFVIFEEGRGHLDEEGLKGVAKELSLDETAFAGCLNSESARKTVEQDQMELDRLLAQVSASDRAQIGTPLFFINGRLLVGAHPFERFKQIIEAELAKQRK